MEQFIKEFGERANEIVAWLKDEVVKLRSNRPSPKLIEHVKVSYLNEDFRVNQLGAITVQPPRELVIVPWDKGAIGSIARGIEAANLGVSVMAGGEAVRIALPTLTDERRKEILKLANSLAEEARIRMRSARDKILKGVSALADEDQRFRSKNEIQKRVDAFNKEIEELVASKERELAEM
ncbi:MAG: ribosome-recycling factor [Candidatus Colwellbacteria bacterium]|nr:ribosome-recycling factor [Candidatus Colwellbacteria bacterium]